MGLVKAGIIVTVIVLIEVAAAIMMLPSAKDTEATAAAVLAAGHKEHAEGEEHDTEGGEHGEGSHLELETDEMMLGAFNVTRYDPGRNTTLTVDFELYGVVHHEEEALFTEKFAKAEMRIRESVIMVLHGAQAESLSQGLHTIKRPILEKVNTALGQPLVREVVFSKFNFVER